MKKQTKIQLLAGLSHLLLVAAAVAAVLHIVFVVGATAACLAALVIIGNAGVDVSVSVIVERQAKQPRRRQRAVSDL